MDWRREAAVRVWPDLEVLIETNEELMAACQTAEVRMCLAEDEKDRVLDANIKLIKRVRELERNHSPHPAIRDDVRNDLAVQMAHWRGQAELERARVDHYRTLALTAPGFEEYREDVAQAVTDEGLSAG